MPRWLAGSRSQARIRMTNPQSGSLQNSVYCSLNCWPGWFLKPVIPFRRGFNIIIPQSPLRAPCA
jgi:hypothetical protein